MKRFVPKEKLSKKARRAVNSQQRLTWQVSPVTKVFKSKKDYKRKQKSYDYLEDGGRGIFYL